MMREWSEQIGVLWCRFWHEGIIRGAKSYECAVCLRKFSLPWTPADQIENGVWRSE